jgi:RND family efflux transporter MFP subunit
MSESTESPSGGRKALTWLICVALIAVAFAVLYVINSTEPEAERESATLKRAMLVEVAEAEEGTFRPVIVETGTVAPAKDIQLAPQVGGRVVDIHPDFTPGGFIDAGEVILQIEPDDYENLVAQRESELVAAETDLALEMGRQQVAERDFELLGERLPEGKNNLVLREPQLAAAKTRVDAAKAALEQAKLDLKRTKLRSPFDAQILSRMANLGSQVSEGMPVAEIVGVEKYWVMATVSPSKLPFIQFPRGDAPGASVELYKRGTGGTQLQRTGRLYRLVGELEANTRLARVVIEVEDPLSLEPDSAELPPLLVGEFLEVHIKGEALQDVIRMPLDYLRKNNTAWIMSEDDKLEVRELEIVFKDSRYAYVTSGLAAGERIVTSSLSRVTEGVDLRTEEANANTAE